MLQMLWLLGQAIYLLQLLKNCVKRLHDSSAGPQTGVALPNGVVPNRGGPTERAPKEEIRSSEIPKFRIFDKIAEKRIFYEGF